MARTPVWGLLNIMEIKVEAIIKQIEKEEAQRNRIAQSERNFVNNVLLAGAFDRILAAQAKNK